MIYLFGSNVPENKPVVFALTYIYGLGKAHSTLICKKLGFSKNLKIQSLSRDQIFKILNVIQTLNLKLGGDLKKLKILTNKRLTAIKSYRGLRKIQGLPIRGQRTHTNARTARKKMK
jgi:small subunit ribosomal protein S13